MVIDDDDDDAKVTNAQELYFEFNFVQNIPLKIGLQNCFQFEFQKFF